MGQNRNPIDCHCKKFQHFISGLSHTKHTQEVYQSDLPALKIRINHLICFAESAVQKRMRNHNVRRWLLLNEYNASLRTDAKRTRPERHTET